MTDLLIKKGREIELHKENTIYDNDGSVADANQGLLATTRSSLRGKEEFSSSCFRERLDLLTHLILDF